MKCIGFLDIHDADIKCSKSIDELILFSKDYKNTREDTLNSIAYLEGGIPLIKFISPIYFNDEHVEPYIIYSDGTWIWPSYYIHYLKKLPNVLINDRFIEHIKLNQFQVPTLSTTERHYLEYILTKLLNIKINIEKESMEEIKPLVTEKGIAIECF